LLRPGRFDRQVILPLPDIKGERNLENSIKNKKAESESFEEGG
jgi:ATP-dependent Zn protease